MNPMIKIYSTVLLPTQIGLLVIYFFAIALRLLIKRRPVILSSRWTIAFLAVAFAPSMLNAFVFSGVAKGMDMMFWIQPVMFGTIFIFILIQMKGYSTFGVTEAYFREALLSTVSSLGYTAEETISCLRIKETGQEIKIMIQGLSGSAQLRPKSKDSAELVKQIAQGMRAYFQSHSGKTNMLIAYFYLLMGGFLLAIAISLTRIMARLH